MPPRIPFALGLTAVFVLALSPNLLIQPTVDSVLPGDNEGELSDETRMGIVEAYGQLPLSFEINQGQTDEPVRFLSRGSGYTLFLTPEEAVLSLRRPVSEDADSTAVSDVLRLQLVGANPDPEVTGLEQQPGRSNYFIGNDPAQWRTDVPHFGQVRYEQVYPGVDLVYYGTVQNQLEYDFVLAPGADPGVIRLGFAGADRMRLNQAGDLVVPMAGGEVVLQAPVAYQAVDGERRRVSSRYLWLEGEGDPGVGPRVGFAVGTYDPSRELIIDPVLSYATYLGGSSLDYGWDIAVDGSGNAYVTGQTGSSDFPTVNAVQGTSGGSYEAFVSKLNAAGSALVYSTYLGGSNFDYGWGIAVDGAGNAYVAGLTYSTNFPTVNALQATSGGPPDDFVAKLNAAGSALDYST